MGITKLGSIIPLTPIKIEWVRPLNLNQGVKIFNNMTYKKILKSVNKKCCHGNK